ncbi:helix-turn-helix domain-containing protein [Cellulomonas soli]|uniref:helix-turn-helix domain-containing protein n=1 Tax=Cellulomonas soli TaxID=931535 RepID=UPI003F863D16
MKDRPIERRSYTLVEAATATGVSAATLRRAIHTSDYRYFPPPLRAKLAGRKYLILVKDLDAWLESLPDA